MGGKVMYKEVSPFCEVTDKWKVLTINAGASQSTLQDIKLPETAGCYTYKESNILSEVTSNRFIYWRTSNEIVELVEISLDVTLKGNHLRLHFHHTPILQGMSIHETHDHVVVLIPTVSTIHKLKFPHPRKTLKSNILLKESSSVLPSIFFNATSANLCNPSNFFVLNHASTGIPLPHTSCSWLTSDGDAAFVLANSAGSHLLVVMLENQKDKIFAVELNRTSVMSRLWKGLVRGSHNGDIALSIICHKDSSDVYIFSLCRDLRIRMWSHSRQECLMIASVLEHSGESENTSWNFTAQQCYLKKSVDPSSKDFYIGVYISLPQQTQFCIFQTICVNDQYHMSHIGTIYHEQHDLVDFCLTSSYLWTLWLNSDSEPIVKLTAFDSCESCKLRRLHNCKIASYVGWFSVLLQPPVSRDVFVPLRELEPREAYLKEIFRQGRFSPFTISKAISIYRRSIDPSISAESAPEVKILKEEAIKAVENEILSRKSESELTDDEYRELQIECWDQFFSYCIQYNEVETKPLSIAFDASTGYAVIVKKSTHSILLPCDTFEELILSAINEYNPPLFCMNIFPRVDLMLSITIIFDCLDVIRHCYNEEMLITFEHDLFHLISPDEAASTLIKSTLSNSDGNLLMKLNISGNVIPALIYLLQKLDLGVKEDSEAEDLEITSHVNYPYFLSSAAGASLLCEGLTQFINQRFSFCRDLFILEKLMLQRIGMCDLSSENANKIEFDIMPKTKLLVQAYSTLKLCVDYEFVTSQNTLLESGLRQLTLLDAAETPFTSQNKPGYTIGKTVIYWFLVDQARKQAYARVSRMPVEEPVHSGSASIFPVLIINTAKLLWPLGPHFLFPEFLLAQCQYLPLLDYIRRLQNWCTWNGFSRLFLAANCHLFLGEHWKAVRFFTLASPGIETDEFLYNKVMQGIDVSRYSSLSQYYMKVIQLFEHFGLSNSIITLANDAVILLKKGDPYIPIFYSLIFKHHLELGHSEEAYIAMISNPDPSRQKDCLRQLIVVLCERKHFQTLVNFPYYNMENDVISILESRARSSDLLQQKYYDLLYAFHVHNNNYRRAASIMYEYGMRLGQEVNSIEGLDKQETCYLAALNCLHIVDPKYAWIVKPVSHISNFNEKSEVESQVNSSPKRNEDGEEKPPQAPRKKIEVLEMHHIRREYDLIHARLLLVQRDCSPLNIAATPLSASDTVTLLISAGLFKEAIGLCKSFSLSLTAIFEGLTYKCVKTQQSMNQSVKKDDEYDWLTQNDANNLPSNESINNREQIWNLLKCYLEQYEKKGQSVFYRCVTCILLSSGIHLPAWLKRSYQVRNASELLFLYIRYGLLENATNLAVDYIDALLGHGLEDFGLKYSLHASNPPVWLPHTYIDALIDALEEVQSEPHYIELYKKLTVKIQRFNDTVESVSKDMIALKSQQ